jgi:rhodanese-related sulfurtransferase
MAPQLKNEIVTAAKDGATLILVSLATALLFLKTAELKSSKPTNTKMGMGASELQVQTTNTIQLAELKEMMAKSQNDLVIVDTRDTFFFQMGHIPNAINIPIETFNLTPTTYQAQLPQTSTIVVYCARESCTDSEKMALKLTTLGYKKLLIYKGGYEEWEETLKATTQ